MPTAASYIGDLRPQTSMNIDNLTCIQNVSLSRAACWLMWVCQQSWSYDYNANETHNTGTQLHYESLNSKHTVNIAV